MGKHTQMLTPERVASFKVGITVLILSTSKKSRSPETSRRAAPPLQSTNHLHVHSLHVLPATSYYTACPSRRACVDSETLTFHYIPIDARCRGLPTQVGQKDEGIAQLEITAALSQHTPHVFCMRGQRTGLPRRHQYHLQSMIGIREHREMDAMELLDALATTHERNGLGQVPCFARSTRCVATALLA
jgi:hypothetical protein